MKNSGQILLQDRRCISGECNGAIAKRFKAHCMSHFIEQQHFELFFTAVEWCAFLPVLRRHLFAEVTFTVAGRLGFITVLAQSGRNFTLVNDKTR